MNQKQTTVIFFLLALISALILRQSGAELVGHENCDTTAIDKVPGCYDALRLASDSDYRWLSKDCCQAVSTFLDPCFLVCYPGKSYPINIFQDICSSKFPGSN
ncbi:hypothetical protein EUTSA_v10017888mg [Eutrema salsugineum]|uniref:Prolamin-like domain-containing protein n=1 Tax=Eutrema salsugineum TaxID=72664 RepID=V4NYZ0_EUTSA|nr:uncharacterized protein LOC18027114 [Eutrema salsugineum]ESQ52181.1 hypothetical protein EUTSA_v10017888mg [Eutrema salsugineum]